MNFHLKCGHKTFKREIKKNDFIKLTNSQRKRWKS